MRRRQLHHLVLACLTVVSLSAAIVYGPAAQALDRFSIVSAYVCFALFAGALLLGPLRAIRGGRPSTNDYLRRDIGVWAALIGIAHLVIATGLSMDASYLDAYVNGTSKAPSEGVRTQLFAWGSILGFVVGLVFLMLLALSSNQAIRLLGPRLWKKLQRTSYLAFALSAIHGFAFQILESREWILIAVILLTVALVIAAQLMGVMAVRRTTDTQSSVN